MNLLKKFFPGKAVEISNSTDNKVTTLPFYVKELGYINDSRFSRGNSNNYSDYLIIYSMANMSFTKYDKKYLVMPHDIILSACNTPLLFVQPRMRRESYIYIVISGRHAQQFYNLVRTNNCIYRSSQYNNISDFFLSLLAIDFKEDPLMAQLEAGMLIYQLFFNLYKISTDILAAKNMFPTQDTAINMAISYIEKNYKDNMDIDTICSNIGFSKFYFCKMFKEYMGVTLHQYVTEYRISKARDLLSYSKLSITAVANSVGYKNVLTFTRNFEKLQHMTPSEYRKYY